MLTLLKLLVIIVLILSVLNVCLLIGVILEAVACNLNHSPKRSLTPKVAVNTANATSKHMKGYFVVSIVEVRNNPKNLYFICGGAILSIFWIVTAGHCIYDFINNSRINKDKIAIFANIDAYTLEKFEIHPDFDNHIKDNDIGLIKVTKPFRGWFGKHVIVAADGYVLRDKTNFTVNGWGMKSKKYFLSKSAHTTDIQIYSQTKCRHKYQKRKEIDVTEQTFCAVSFKEDEEDEVDEICRLDIGGPVCEGDVLVGIVSWIKECGSLNFPGIYTKISVFENWIHEIEEKYNEMIAEFKS